MSANTTVGARPMETAYNPERLTLGLYGKNGSGKTAGAASFVGAEAGGGIYMNVEAGVNDGAGGATTLFNLDGIFDHVSHKDFLTLDVRDWQDAENQTRWLQREATKLLADGRRTLIVDSGTEAVILHKRALTRLDPAKLKGNTDARGNEDSAKKNHKRALVPWADGRPGRSMEFDDWDYLSDSFFFFVDTLKELPFRLIFTFTEGQGFDENTGSKLGFGPSTEGQKIGKGIMGHFDAFFHCRVTETGQRVWLTQNMPGQDAGGDPYHAKHRFGKRIGRSEIANGLALMKRLGIVKTKEAPK